jgi:hypothetical protein
MLEEWRYQCTYYVQAVAIVLVAGQVEGRPLGWPTGRVVVHSVDEAAKGGAQAPLRHVIRYFGYRS